MHSLQIDIQLAILRIQNRNKSEKNNKEVLFTKLRFFSLKFNLYKSSLMLLPSELKTLIYVTLHFTHQNRKSPF